MSEQGEGRPWWELLPLRIEPIKVQGMTIHPGEDVLIAIDETGWVMRFKGWAEIPAGMKVGIVEPADEPRPGYWMEGEPGTAPEMWPGPYPMSALKHPNLLEGMAREISEA